MALSRRKKRFTFVLVAFLLLSGAGAAFAFWTSTGTGDGTAETGTSTDFTIVVGTAAGTIEPGGPGQTVGFTVTNPGPGPQTLTSVAVTMADAAGVAWVPPAGCLIADYHATVTTAPAAGELAEDGTATGTVTVTLDNTTVNQDACQGAPVPLHLVAS